MKDLRTDLIQELERAHSGTPWHGPSRAAVLDGLTPARAAWKPRADAHSIWELVLHMTSWADEVLQRAKGRVPGEPDDGDWPAVPEPQDDAAWRGALQRLDAAHQALVDAVRALPAQRLEERVGTGSDPNVKGISVRAMIHSLVQHDIYHTGQCAMLKRLAEAA